MLVYNRQSVLNIGSAVPMAIVLALCLLVITNASIAQGNTVEEISEELIEQNNKIQVLENKLSRLEGNEWLQRMLDSGIDITGVIELAAFHSREKEEDGDVEYSDIVLDTIEIGIAIQFTESIRGYIQLESEEGGEVTTEEGLVHFYAEDVMEPDIALGSHWYASIGKMTLPFGYYESRLPSDSYLTRKLGKTEEAAIVMGAHAGAFNFALGMFNSRVDEIDASDHIDTFTGTLILTLPEDSVPGLELKTGGSYITNITGSKKLKKLFPSGEIEEIVPGINYFLSASINERYFLEVEHIASMDSFLEDTKRIEPKAWNYELGFQPMDDLELAVRYGRSEKPPSFLPEKQKGAAGIYQMYDNIAISLEYLFNEFENDDTEETINLKLEAEI